MLHGHAQEKKKFFMPLKQHKVCFVERLLLGQDNQPLEIPIVESYCSFSLAHCGVDGVSGGYLNSPANAHVFLARFEISTYYHDCN